jgi:hypothetical protein
VAEQTLADLLHMGRRGKRECDRIHAYDVLLNRLGIRPADLEPVNTGGDFIINVSFTPKKTPPPDDPPKFIDQLPGGPTP